MMIYGSDLIVTKHSPFLPHLDFSFEYRYDITFHVTTWFQH